MEAESSSVEEGPQEPRALVSDLLTGFSQLNVQWNLEKTKKIASLHQVNQQLMLEQCDPKASFLKYYLHVMNTGDEVALQELRGIGEKIATRILEVRPFTSVDDLAAKLEFSDGEMKRLLKMEAKRVYSSMF